MSKKLDINSKRGQETVRQEQIMLKYIEECWGVQVVSTKKKDDDADAACDGFLIKDGEVVALFESKCRKLSYEKLKEYDSWLVTYAKIEKCRLISEYLKIPFLGLIRRLFDTY